VASKPVFESGSLIVGSQPAAIAIGNFNQDSFPDLAVANNGDSTVSILIGNGTGGFTPSLPAIPVGNNPVSVVALNATRDSSLDLAVVNLTDGTVSILLGDGKGHFTQAPESPIKVGNFPMAIVPVDFNGNGKIGLAVVNMIDGTVSILLGDGTGRFTQAPESPIKVGKSPIAIAAGNFRRGVGNLDLAVVNKDDETVSILLGDGTGRFTQAPDSPIKVGKSPTAIAAGNFRRGGVGNLDLAVVNRDDETVSILLGDGTGRFALTPSPPVQVGSDPVAIAVGDLTGSGTLSLVVANQRGPTISLLTGDGKGGFSVTDTIQTGANPIFVALGDFKHEGKLDIAVANNNLEGTLSIFLNQGAGGFANANPIAMDLGINNVSRWCMAVGDFGGNGQSDLAVVAQSFPKRGTVITLLGNGAGGFTPLTDCHPITVGLRPIEMVAGIFTATGKLDLAVLDTDDFELRSTVFILLGDGTGCFASGPVSPIAVEKEAFTLVAGDFNGDGKVDLAVGSRLSISILKGDGTGRFALALGSPITLEGVTGEKGDDRHFGRRAEISAMAAGDFTGTGKLDLAVSYTKVILHPIDHTQLGFQDELAILLNNGDGGFLEKSIVPNVPIGRTLLVGDFFTGDHNLDIALATPFTLPITNKDGLNILRGDGTGSFVLSGRVVLPRDNLEFVDGSRFAVADFDNDGNLDIAYAFPSDKGELCLSILTSDGHGHFTATDPPRSLDFTSGLPPAVLKAANFNINQDGLPDLALLYTRDISDLPASLIVLLNS
jgi:hypothetical protein